MARREDRHWYAVLPAASLGAPPLMMCSAPFETTMPGRIHLHAGVLAAASFDGETLRNSWQSDLHLGIAAAPKPKPRGSLGGTGPSVRSHVDASSFTNCRHRLDILHADRLVRWL